MCVFLYYNFLRVAVHYYGSKSTVFASKNIRKETINWTLISKTHFRITFPQSGLNLFDPSNYVIIASLVKLHHACRKNTEGAE